MVLILVFVIGCTPPPDADQPPEAPSSMVIEGDEDGSQDTEETESEVSETVDSFIKTTEVLQAEDGSAVVQIETHDDLVDGTYQARHHDPEGGELSAPCLRIEGTDNELQCSLALPPGLKLVEFQLYYQEPFEPFFTAGVDFTGTALVDLFPNVDLYILPPEFQPKDPVDNFDLYAYLSALCEGWEISSQKPDSLDSICLGLTGSEPLSPLGDLSETGKPGSLSGVCLSCSTPPDPDCDGKDAGSFWCQETGEQQYVAGRLAHACLDQIDTAFEDPLTAFEDPRTAMDVARTTILYRVAFPFIPNPAPLTACNRLALLGDHSQYQRNGQSLIEYLAGYYPSFQPVSKRITLDTSDLIVLPDHCDAFNDMNFESRVQLYFENHTGFIDFDAAEPLPGIHFFIIGLIGDTTPYDYSATLGGIELNTCTYAGDTGLRCGWDNLPESFYGQEQEYALYVTGCEEPLHTGTIALPAYDYSRCTVFGEMDLSLYVADPSTNLTIAVGMPDGVPGLEVEDYPGFDNFDVFYFSRFCGELTSCEVHDWSPGYLYCNMSVGADCLTTFNVFELAVEQCGLILTRTLQIIAPTHGGGMGDQPGSGDGGGGGAPTCTATGAELSQIACESKGGIWNPGHSAGSGTCACP